MTPGPPPAKLWHVTVLLCGAPSSGLVPAVRRLCERDPGNMGARYRSDYVELQFWDEGADIAQVATAACRLWREARQEAGLPDWAVVGLQVLDRHRLRERSGAPLTILEPGSVRPLR